ncbi:hypothetical protein K435DRAFT_621673, partial [Dendrothele bispora CBS 962.96]
RQELRELELLDEITKLRHEESLLIIGDRRSSIIKNFRDLKGLWHNPNQMHVSLRWDNQNPFEDAENNSVSWKIIVDRKIDSTEKQLSKGNFVPAQGAKTTDRSVLNKRKQSFEKDKDAETSNPYPDKLDYFPTLKWSNNSCAYDSMIIMLYHFYRL